MRTRTILTAGALAALTGPTLWADILRVPSQYPTIQSAIDAASHGDTVLIADGVYTGPGNKNLDFGGRAITVESENGRENCIIDCELDGRAFYFHSGEGPDSVLRGLTIREGRVGANDPLGHRGGGILCIDSAPQIVDCSFIRCVADGGSHEGDGGALFAERSPVRLRDCDFFDSYADANGGALALLASDATIKNCDFEENITGLTGGAIFMLDSSVLITRCDFLRNVASEATGYGSAIDCRGVKSQTRIARSRFEDNGGGTPAIYVAGASLSVEDSTFTGHWTSWVPSAIQDEGRAWIERCQFIRNRGVAAVHGAMAILDSVFYANGGSHHYPGAIISAGSIVNCTIAGNGSLRGAVIEGTGPLVNCILWDNRPSSIQPWAVVEYSIVEGGWSGPGNLNAEPRFVDYLGGDLRLQSDSPAIDAGDPASERGPGSADFDGQLRLWNGRIDMGADEFGSFVYGDLNCDGALDAFDIEPFILALTDPQQYTARHPGCEAILADLNGDGVVDAFDISPFIDALTEQ